MSIQRLTIHACAYGVMLACSTQVLADAPPWNGSYVADGSCFCVGEQSRKIDSRIVPTPIGGQSVAQVCARVGEGPTLQKINGKFNLTVYPDAQCGNGPFPDATANRNDQCLGNLGVSGEDCSARGPRWDLGDAYSRAAKIPELNSKNSIVTGGSRHIKPPTGKLAADKLAEMKSNKQETTDTTVADVVRSRSNSTKLTKQAPQIFIPEKREQIRARQVEQLAAARKRAKLAEGKKSKESTEDFLPQVAAATVDSVKVESNSLKKPAKVAIDSNSLKTPAKVAVESNSSKTPAKVAVESNSSKQPAKVADTSNKPEKSTKAAVESVAETAATPSIATSAPTTVAALKVPAVARHRSPDFDYIEAAPVSYDFGGAGVSVEASKSSHDRMQYIVNAAVADTYREAAIGVGMFFRPPVADNVTVMLRAGFEYGLFNFSNDNAKADVSDTGAFVGLVSRVSVTRQFVLQAGVSYSSFFEGDAVGFGSALYQLTPKLDLTAKAEAGDNDMLGFGIRYHY